MSTRRGLTLVLLALALAATVDLARHALVYRDHAAYNRALAAARYDQAAAHAGEAGRFAAAYGAQLAGRLQEAREIYGGLERSGNPSLAVAALYNAGNTYLEQALAIDRSREADRVVPLVELAKRSYRDALRRDPHHWDTRYNLERALALQPDAADKQVIEVEGRRGTVRTVVGGEDESPWP